MITRYPTILTLNNINNMKPPNYKMIFSSGLFIIPCIYGYYNKKYLLSCVSFLSMAASINYWRYPVPGGRKNIDILISKATGIIYFIYGYNNVHNAIFQLFGYTNGFFIISMYNASCILHELNSDSWEYFHILFHISSIIGKMIVLGN